MAVDLKSPLPAATAQRGADPRLLEYVRRSNQAGGAYHRIDLGDGLVLDGDYDIPRYLHHYGFPADLTGLRVLDVGTSTGFFALELARRGGRVTAIDIWDDHPLPMLARHLDLDVTYVQQDLYGLSEEFGRFDLVFMGSVLLHLWDQHRALRAVRSVCAGQAIVATDVMRPTLLDRLRRYPRPRAELLAARGEGGDVEYWATWRLSAAAAERLLWAAGFERISHHATFDLASTGSRRFTVRHGVFHAWV